MTDDKIYNFFKSWNKIYEIKKLEVKFIQNKKNGG